MGRLACLSEGAPEKNEARDAIAAVLAGKDATQKQIPGSKGTPTNESSKRSIRRRDPRESDPAATSPAHIAACVGEMASPSLEAISPSVMSNCPSI